MLVALIWLPLPLAMFKMSITSVCVGITLGSGSPSTPRAVCGGVSGCGVSCVRIEAVLDLSESH